MKLLTNIKEYINSLKYIIITLCILLSLPFTIAQYWDLNIFPLSEISFYKNTFLISVLLIIYFSITYVITSLIFIGNLEKKIFDKIKFFLIIPAYIYMIYDSSQMLELTLMNKDIISYVLYGLLFLTAIGLFYSSNFDTPEKNIKEIITSKSTKIILAIIILYIIPFLIFEKYPQTINSKLLKLQQKDNIKVYVKNKYCKFQLNCQEMKNSTYSLATVNKYFETSKFLYISTIENNETIVRSILKSDILGETLPIVINDI